MKIEQPNTVQYRCTQIWHATPDQVFPLLCPVRETEWIPDWNPRLVVSKSGFMEQDCIFIESGQFPEAIWVVNQYALNHYVEMYRILPGVTVSKFSIRLAEGAKNNTTQAELSYAHIAISSEGNEFIKGCSNKEMETTMNHFNEAINCYLSTGKKISN